MRRTLRCAIARKPDNGQLTTKTEERIIND